MNKDEAYLAMYAFLDHWYELTKSSDVGALLGSLSLLEDGMPADPALKEDWERAVRRALGGTIDARLRLK